MKFEETQEGKRIIYCEEEELKCSVCGRKDTEYLYFCEQNRCLYCSSCLSHGKACQNNQNHVDHKIDRFEVVKNSRGSKIQQEMPKLWV